MKILFISQVFWPDTASVAQHLWDLASTLEKEGHKVSAFSSKFSYENASIKFVDSEMNEGVWIDRINHSAFGKKNISGRLIDFFTFNVAVFFKMLFLKKKSYDLIIGTTVPPLLSFLAVIAAKKKKIPFCYWTMDMQPELAIASGMIKKKSLSTSFLEFIGNYTIRKSNFIFTLDNYMKNYLLQKGAKSESIFVVPVWPVMDEIYQGMRMDNPFRKDNGFGNKIVIMYSGNHAFVHPLDTLLQVALKLKQDERFLFVFIGGGVRKKDVSDYKLLHNLNNITQLPYQPRNNIHNSLGASDLQVVIMGKNQVGFTHPNKVYGALFIGKPIVYIGPSPSHVSDILDLLNGNIIVEHGQVEKLVKNLVDFASLNPDVVEKISKRNMDYAQLNLQPSKLKMEMVSIIENQK